MTSPELEYPLTIGCDGGCPNCPLKGAKPELFETVDYICKTERLRNPFRFNILRRDDKAIERYDAVREAMAVNGVEDPLNHVSTVITATTMVVQEHCEQISHLAERLGGE